MGRSYLEIGVEDSVEVEKEVVGYWEGGGAG